MLKNKTQWYKRSLLIIIIVILIISNLEGFKVLAEDNRKNIVILLDNSGSMNNPETKIGDLAKVAGSMVLDTIRESEVNISIITFGTKVTVLKGLQENKDLDEVKKELNEVTMDEQGTNVKDGLKKAIDELNETAESKSIIILSDGKEEPIEGITDEHIQELNNLIDDASKANIKVNTIALSNDVDEEFLSKIATNTGGLFRDGKSANKLFESLTAIIGGESDFSVIENYTTDSEKMKEITLSSFAEEIIINVAACDNKKPQINVKLNNTLINPTKTGNMYEVYRFTLDNNTSSVLKIESIGEEISSVIVQFKSKAKLNVVNQFNKYISVPKNIPIDMKLSIDAGNNEIDDGTFIVCNNGDIINPTEEEGIFNYSFLGKEEGENVIRYIAKDKSNGIIAVLEMIININDYPAFYYKNIKEEITEDESLRIEIELKDNTKVSNISGEVIVNQGGKTEKIPLEANGNILFAEFKINGTDDIKYYANIRGKNEENTELFAYPLPMINLKVNNKERIILSILDNDEIVKAEEEKKLNKNVISDSGIIVGKEANIALNILDKSIINKNTNVLIFDKDNEQIGSFNISKEEKGIITTTITPNKKEKNLELFFKTDNGIEVTESLKTNLNVNTSLGFILEKLLKVFLYLVIPIVTLILLGFLVYKALIKRYKLEVEETCISVSFEYKINPNGIYRNIGEGYLSSKNRRLYLNINNKKELLYLDEEEENALGYFEFVNKYQNRPKLIQGLYSYKNKDNMFYVEYNTIEEINDDTNNQKIKYEPGITIPYKVGKKVINIDF